MIRILHVVSVMDIGGMETFIMNLYRHADRNNIQFDFLVHHRRRGAYEDEIETLGGKVYHASLMDDGNLLKYKRYLHRLFQEHLEYRIVHGHLGSTAVWYLGEAERRGVPWRILHSHCPAKIHTLKGTAKDFLFRFGPQHANIYLACSREAGEYQFRNKAFETIPNGIDTKHFLFDSVRRSEIRKKLNLENHYVIGHVGRFYHEKNHRYLLNMFHELLKIMPDAVLMLVGDGSLMGDITTLAKELGIHQKVLFMGLQKDTASLYQAMDVFVMPSVYEGLPLAGVEAQCAGLPCIFTENISKEIEINDQVYFLPIGEKDISMWTRTITNIRRKESGRAHLLDAASRFDAACVSQDMLDRYQQLWEHTE